MNNGDRIFEAFLTKQLEEGLALAAASDILELLPIGTEPPRRYIAEFSCRGLVRRGNNEIGEWNHFRAGIHFPSNYLRSADPFSLVTWLGPPTPEYPNVFVWHPNVSVRAPVICLGKISAGMSLTDLLHQIYEIITFQRYCPNEFDSLNADCCKWARTNSGRFPTDNRPLKRRTLNLDGD